MRVGWPSRCGTLLPNSCRIELHLPEKVVAASGPVPQRKRRLLNRRKVRSRVGADTQTTHLHHAPENVVLVCVAASRCLSRVAAVIACVQC
jgi:hypothetical protein